MKQVTKNVYVEGRLPCNVGIITTKEGIVMVDTPMNPAVAVKMRDEIKKMGELRYVINTEEHGEHCHNSWFFPGTLITSQATRDRLVNTPVSQVKGMVQNVYPDGLPFMESS